MRTRNIILMVVALMVLPLVIAACGSATEEAASPTPSPSPTMAQKDIVDTAVEAGSFSTLVSAVQAAGLEETLRGEGPYTVFAPTDDAFAAVPKETLDALLADPTGALTDVLTYHVVAGKVMSTDLSDGMQAETVNGQPLDITVADDGTVMVNGATVVTADIETANGVIHVIDTVLVPPSE
jgi:transforming growth factor-beta-induced protein